MCKGITFFRLCTNFPQRVSKENIRTAVLQNKAVKLLRWRLFDRTKKLMAFYITQLPYRLLEIDTRLTATFCFVFASLHQDPRLTCVIRWRSKVLNTEADVKMAKEQSKTIITSLSLHGQLSIVKQLKLLSWNRWVKEADYTEMSNTHTPRAKAIGLSFCFCRAQMHVY